MNSLCDLSGEIFIEYTLGLAEHFYRHLCDSLKHCEASVPMAIQLLKYTSIALKSSAQDSPGSFIVLAQFGTCKKHIITRSLKHCKK